MRSGFRGVCSQDLDLKFGRQIVVWGKADNIRVVDVLNPLDYRELGLVDIEDLRLPVTMTRLDYYFGDWNLTGVVVHEIRYNKEPAYGSDFYPSAAPPPGVEEPRKGFGEPQFGAALNGIFTGWDLSFYFARYFDDMAHLELTYPPLGLRRVHSRLTMFGTSVNAAFGNWLFKAEAAYLDGLKYTLLPGQTKSRVDLLLGMEYSGFTDTTLTLEAANRHILDYNERLTYDPGGYEENEFQAALRVTRTFMHERLTLNILAMMFGYSAEGGSLERVSLTYDIDDHWSVTGGVILYQAGDEPALKKLELNDRVYFDIKYGF